MPQAPAMSRLRVLCCQPGGLEEGKRGRGAKSRPGTDIRLPRSWVCTRPPTRCRSAAVMARQQPTDGASIDSSSRGSQAARQLLYTLRSRPARLSRLSRRGRIRRCWAVPTTGPLCRSIFSAFEPLTASPPGVLYLLRSRTYSTVATGTKISISTGNWNQVTKQEKIPTLGEILLACPSFGETPEAGRLNPRKNCGLQRGQTLKRGPSVRSAVTLIETLAPSSMPSESSSPGS